MGGAEGEVQRQLPPEQDHGGEISRQLSFSLLLSPSIMCELMSHAFLKSKVWQQTSCTYMALYVHSVPSQVSAHVVFVIRPFPACTSVGVVLTHELGKAWEEHFM